MRTTASKAMTNPVYAVTGASGHLGRLAVQELLDRIPHGKGRRDLSTGMDGRPIYPPSGHVLLEPLERRLWTSLKLEVAIPACGRVADPMELLVGDRDVVEH